MKFKIDFTDLFLLSCSYCLTILLFLLLSYCLAISFTVLLLLSCSYCLADLRGILLLLPLLSLLIEYDISD